MQHLPSGRPGVDSRVVTARPQPPTATGVVFFTLEVETGSVNVIVGKNVSENQHAQALRLRLLAVCRCGNATQNRSALVPLAM